ncbi:MAG: Redoxin domain protein [Candidatus Solibacter sp.]|nr:Redoxin domain protein [Candidatus Solibacter sp.]
MKTLTISLLMAIGAMVSGAMAQPVDGLWDATVKVNGNEIPFRMEFAGTGDAVRGNFFNGDERVPSSGGTLRDGALRLNFDSYANRLEATVGADGIDGRYGREGRWYEFHARRPVRAVASAAGAPNIDGLWEIPTKSSKGEAAWRLIVRQKAGEVSAAILRVDGDTGALTGTWRGGKFVLSHFSGARPNLLELTPAADGSLELLQNGRTKLTALRPAAARAQGLSEPTDPFHHTGVKDPSAAVEFAFPDVDGRTVSLSDARFAGKAIVLAISGSWCPNCHDEAPFLEELYRKYRAEGLEVIALSFEEEEQLKSLSRLRAFVKEYGIDYTVLVPGEPGELAAKFPQGENLNSWPTTFFLGRDHRVRGVHAGYAGRASGEFHKQTKEEITAIVERLLAEGTSAGRRE